MKSQDFEFKNALESPTALDQRLASLEQTRDITGGLLFILNAVLAIGIAATIWGIGKGAEPGPTLSILPLLILGSLVCYTRKSAVQNEIRTLLVFKKLRDQIPPAN